MGLFLMGKIRVSRANVGTAAFGRADLESLSISGDKVSLGFAEADR